MPQSQFRRNRLKLLISACVLSAVLVIAAVAQRKHVATDPFAPDQTRSRTNDRERPVFGKQAEPPSRELPLQEQPSKAAAADPADAGARGGVTAGRDVPADVLGFLERWRSSLANKNLDAHVSTYAPRVNRFFTKRGVSREQVRKEKAQMFAKYPDINKYDIRDVRLEKKARDRAVVTFRKDWDTSGSKRFAGSERQRLTLRRADGTWQITGEEELKVYWVRRG